MRREIPIAALFVLIIIAISCSKSGSSGGTTVDPYIQTKATFGSKIDPNNLANYASQGKPVYITKDNTGANVITDAKATLGRVLFYDKNLSIDNSISCGSCHKQAFGFGDQLIASNGVLGGTTARHTMRLVNSRFEAEVKYFWDERAPTLEFQTTQPIQNSSEMGFSGTSGHPNLAALLTKLQAIGYYNELFKFVYGDINVTEARIQECLAQFVRSIQSFDSRFDVGRATAPNDGAPFTNYTASENSGKQLYLAPPVFNATGVRTAGGAGCNQCHKAPEFDIDPNSKNNGITGNLSGTGIDVTVTRSPSLRDVVNPNGNLNAPLMHTANFTTLQAAIAHYANININPANTNLDPRLTPNGHGQQLNLTGQEITDLVAFIKTLTGTNVYSDAKWSDPF